MSHLHSYLHDVRELVVAIPAGRVASYGDLAKRLGISPRQVGRAMSLLAMSAKDGDIPWWRVVHADGRPATCHDGQATHHLADEGTPMRGRRVDLPRARI